MECVEWNESYKYYIYIKIYKKSILKSQVSGGAVCGRCGGDGAVGGVDR